MNRGQRAPTEVQICKTEPERLLLRREREMEASAPHGHSRCGLRPRNLQTGAGAPWADSNVYLGKNYQKSPCWRGVRGDGRHSGAGDMHPGRGRGRGRGRGGRPASCTMPEAPVRPEATTIQGGEAADQAPLLERPDSKCAAQSADPQTPTRRHTLTPRSSRSPPNCRVAAPAPGLVLSGPGRREHSARHRGCGPETRPAAR